MAIIYSYPLNDNIKSLDELVGTTKQTINGQLKTVTRNFLLADIVEFLIIDGGLQKELTLTTEGTSGKSTLNQVTGVLNIPHYPGPNEIAKLTKETFNYSGGSSFTLLNTINNILQVIINTTSLHPVAYEYSLPNTVTILNEIYVGDVITIVYNYLEEIVQNLNLQQVTDEGNHTTNDIIVDNIPGEYGDYTLSNTMTESGSLQSATSVTNNQYQAEYSVDGMSINEIYSVNEYKFMAMSSGLITTSLNHLGGYNIATLNSGSFSIGPRLELTKNTNSGKLMIDNLEADITLQFPDKPEGTYTIATTSDVIPFNPTDYDLDEFTNNNVNYFVTVEDLPVYSDFIQDSITNGVINKAPTENAVYDALQLKQNNLGYIPVNKAGDAMTGALLLHQDPTEDLGAATKQYVDNIAGGITFRSPVFTATTGNLNAAYDNGVDGVGATLIANTDGVIEIDQEFPGVLERILVWKQGNQVDNIQNGIYEVTSIGGATFPFVLTRTADSDNSPAGELAFGDYTFVLSGAVNGGRGFICNTATTIIIGVTPISFVQYNTAQVTTPGYGLEEGPSPGIIQINALETQEKITLTTNFSSGQATLDPITNILNIPQYSGSPGTVTSITASSPLTGGTITSSGTIGIPAATASVSGYLTALNWNTFNDKEDWLDNPPINGYVLSSTTSGIRTWIPMTAGTSYTFNAPLLNTGGTITIPAATTSVNGYLSSGDWTTFNGKAPVNNPTFTGSVVVPNATLSTQAVNKGQLDAAMPSFLEFNSVNSTVWNNGKGNIASNLSFGDLALNSVTTGYGLIAYGNSALRATDIGVQSVAVGNNTLTNSTSGSYNVAIGASSMAGHLSGDNNTAIGATSGNLYTLNNNSVFLGNGANAQANSQTNQIVIGNNAVGAGSNTATLGNDSITSTILKGLVKAPLTTNALIDADSTGKAVVTKEYVNNRLVLEKSGNYTLAQADSGGIIIFTASATLTIPNSLADGFECTFVTLAGATLTVDKGSNILYNNTGTVLLPQLSFTLKRRIATDQFIATGNL
jgi:hypothetical protein